MITLTALTLVFGTGWLVKKAWTAAMTELAAASEPKAIRGQASR